MTMETPMPRWGYFPGSSNVACLGNPRGKNRHDSPTSFRQCSTGFPTFDDQKSISRCLSHDFFSYENDHFFGGCWCQQTKNCKNRSIEVWYIKNHIGWTIKQMETTNQMRWWKCLCFLNGDVNQSCLMNYSWRGEWHGWGICESRQIRSRSFLKPLRCSHPVHMQWPFINIHNLKGFGQSAGSSGPCSGDNLHPHPHPWTGRLVLDICKEFSSLASCMSTWTAIACFFRWLHWWETPGWAIYYEEWAMRSENR